MRIGELARRSGVRAHQLRYYEARGLLKPTRGVNGYRDYGDSDVLLVTQIGRLLDAGLSTAEINSLLPCASGAVPELQPCPELIATLHRRMHDLDERIATLVHSRDALGAYLESTTRNE